MERLISLKEFEKMEHLGLISVFMVNIIIILIIVTDVVQSFTSHMCTATCHCQMEMFSVHF